MHGELVVNPAPATLEVGFLKSGQGKPLIVFDGFPKPNQALTQEQARDLAEAIYQAADFADRKSVPAISLRY